MKRLQLIWASLMTSVAVFVGVCWFLGASMRAPAAPELFVWAALLFAVINSVFSRMVRRTVKGTEQAKSIVSFAFAESACVLSSVAWLLTGDSRCLVGIGVGFVALASLFPRDPRDAETVRLVPPQ